MKWVSAQYQPTTLFSLKPSWATSSGGKSLLLPTPYALKMALLDVAVRVDGIVRAELDWSWLRRVEIYIQLPKQIVVTNLFAKILRQKEFKGKSADKEAFIRQAIRDGNWPFQGTIGYREYVYHPEPIELTFGTDGRNVERLQDWLLNISYLGKRGGFVQLLAPPTVVAKPEQQICLTQDVMQAGGTFPKFGLVQVVDDCDVKMKFDQANIYTGSRPKRLTRQVILPYQLTKSSRSYSLYERVEKLPTF
jgi:hypothetical protein